MVKSVYKYVNEFIDEEKLLKELETFYDNECCEKFKKSTEELILEIKKVNEEEQDNPVLKYDIIYNLLINSKVYLELVDKMNANDLMLLITDYIKANVVPSLDQEGFDAVVEAAINSGKDSKENCWRLATNYEDMNLNLDKIVDYLISTRDFWYVVELMHSLQETLNLDDIVTKIINTKDHKFIKKIVNDNFIQSTLNKDQIKRIKSALDE